MTGKKKTKTHDDVYRKAEFVRKKQNARTIKIERGNIDPIVPPRHPSAAVVDMRTLTYRYPSTISGVLEMYG